MPINFRSVPLGEIMKNKNMSLSARDYLPKQSDFKFNLNYNVKVKLTSIGKSILDDRRHRLNDLITRNGGKPLETDIYKRDKEGYVTFQLWTLMEIFGDYVGLGKALPFDTEIIFVDGEEVPKIKEVRAKVVKNSARHCFRIGEIVTVEDSKAKREEVPPYLGVNDKGEQWYLNTEDIEIIEEEEK